MRLLTLQKVWYGGRERLPGDEFECDDNDFIRILSATDMPGGAKVRAIEPSQEVMLEAPPPPAPAQQQQAPEAAPAAQAMTTADADALVEAPKRRYYRRREQE